MARGSLASVKDHGIFAYFPFGNFHDELALGYGNHTMSFHESLRPATALA
jgi:hypothetical protein